jgi:hypothetical protein
VASSTSSLPISSCAGSTHCHASKVSGGPAPITVDGPPVGRSQRPGAVVRKISDGLDRAGEGWAEPNRAWAWPSAAGLPQRDISPDGIRSSSSRSAGLSKPPSDEVTVWVVVSNPQSHVGAADRHDVCLHRRSWRRDRASSGGHQQQLRSRQGALAGSARRSGFSWSPNSCGHAACASKLAVPSNPTITFSGRIHSPKLGWIGV